MTAVIKYRAGTYGGLVLVAAGMTACDSPTEPNPLDDSPLPVVVGARVVDAGGAVFRALHVQLDRAATVEIEYWSAGSPRLRVASSHPRTTHEIHLPRLRAATPYEYEVTPTASGVAVGATASGGFRTDTLPTALQQLRAHTIGTATFPLLMMEVVLPDRPGVPVIIDRDGFIVWYPRNSEITATGFGVLPGGDFAFLSREGIQVVTPTNGVRRTLTKQDAASRTGLGDFDMHHDVVPTPDGSLLMLVRDTATVNDTVWTGESIWEWEPETDRLEKRWSSFDFLSPNTDQGHRTVPGDWLHANSLSIGPRGNILVSFFWTHEVISIASDFQSLEWRLGGPHSTFTVLDGGMEAGQHTAAEVETDRVLLFDNGRDRPGGELFSRALEIELDRESNTAQIVWEFNPYPTIYAPIVGSARRLPNGNTVICFGLTEGFGDPPSTGPIAIYEVSSGKIEWLVNLEGANAVYRSTPLSTIAGESEVGGEVERSRGEHGSA